MTNFQNRFFISSAIKAFEIKRKFKLYTSEKEYARAGHEEEEVDKCPGTKFSKSFDTVIGTPANVKPSFLNKCLVEDSVENFILKSVVGFLGGTILTYIFFMFLVFSLNFTLKRATYICIGLGVILSLGLAFSVKIRCTVFLCIPQLFSKRGRQALLAYAFILALSGPAKNTLHNVEVMSESLACTQEQLKQAENDLLKCVQEPNAAAKKAIEKLLEQINTAVKDFKVFILQLYKNCFDVLETVLHAQKWLYSITLLCRKKMGRPAHRCLNLLAETSENCEEILPMTAWKDLCGIKPSSQEMICSTNAKFVCMRGDIPGTLPVYKLKKQLDDFKHRAMNILYVSIEAHQTYSQTNRTCTYHEEYQGMATEIRQKTDQFLQYFDFMSVIFGIFILVVFIKVIIYRHKFLTVDHYDNRYITADFVDIDNTRAAFKMDTLLPLAPRERLQYIKVTSIRLVPCERVRLLSSFVFLIFATFKIIIHMLTDSSLYWILSTVRRNERFLYMSTLRDEQPVITVRVVGDGLVAELFRNVTRAVKRESSLVRLDPTPCLPDPVPPDWNRYYQILALVLICWFLAVCEPYGLRLRHSVMVTYHPDRARERAIWLYNRIISNRISFVKVSRRKLRRKYKDVWLEDTFRYKFMSKASSPRCLLCKTVISSVDSCVKCVTSKCAGLYCTACFSCLKYCSICTDPAEYGDLSDLSEEKDSSEEECQRRSLERKTGTKKLVKNKKGEISFSLRKTTLKLKDGQKKGKMTEKTRSESLIQPTLLFRALKYCRSKMPSFRKLKALSDFESSDWDHDSTTILEGSSAEGKCSDLDKKKPEELNKEEQKTKSKQRRLKKKNADGGGEDILEKPSESGAKLRLFRKMSPPPPPPPLSVDEQTKKIFKSKQVPDFYFRVYQGDATPTDVCHLLQTKFLTETEPKLENQSFFPETCRKCESGVLVNDQTIEKELEEEEYTAGFFPPDSPAQIIVDPLELEAKYSEPRKKSPRKLPFIDPTNVHEIDLGTDSGGETGDLASGGRKEAEKAKPRRSHTQCPDRTRVCYKKSDSVRICVKETDASSSSESECQYYYRPFRPPKGHLQLRKTSSELKRASGKLDLKSQKYTGSYSVETDSSNEKFLSVKPSARVRRKGKKVQETDERRVWERREVLDVVRFVKRESSTESGSSDAVEWTTKGIFLSEDEFEKISKEITRRKAEGDSNVLSSRTPDLLLDLPSC